MKLMRPVIVASFLIIQNSFAQDCGDIKNGETNRLDAPGRSLEKGRVQDQDGLGTCYANTASLMLQSVLPNNPEISYLHLSINRAERLVNRDLRSQGRRQAFKDNGDLLLDAGFSCESIKLAKENSGVCERKDVALEKMMFNTDINQYVDNNWVQLDLLKKVSTYYDGMLRDFADKAEPAKGFSFEKKQKPKQPEAKGLSFFERLFGLKKKEETPGPAPVPAPTPNPDENQKAAQDEKIAEKESVMSRFDQYKSALKKVIDQNREEYAKHSCEKMDTTNSLKVAKNALMRLHNSLSTPSLMTPVMEKKMRDFKSKMGTPRYARVSGFTIYEPNVDSNFESKLSSIYLKRLNNPTPATTGESAFREVLTSLVPSNIEKSVVDNVMRDLSADDKALLESDFNRYAKKDYTECATQGRFDYMKNDDGLIKDFQGVGCNSEFLKHVKNLQQMVIGLDSHNFDNIDRLNDFITNLPNMAYDTAMMKLLAPTCTDDKKIKIPPSVNCSSKAFTYPGSATDGPEETNRNLSLMKKNFLDMTKGSIVGNKAVGLSMCTSFYDNNESGAFYNKTNQCDPTKKHGFHAVTMIGYKCVQGKLKYLIQNSWGDWASAEPKFEKDSHGKAWMDEEDLVKNTYQLDVMD